MMPPNKRTVITLSFAEVCVGYINHLFRITTRFYFDSATYQNYNGSTTYTKGDIVKFGYQTFILEADSATGKQPWNTDYWAELQPNWIGAWERARVKPHKIGLEYYMNKFFGTDFNWPSATNDIYIETNSTTLIQFVVGDDQLNTSTISSDEDSSIYFVSDSFSTYSQVNFTIWFPLSVFNSLGSTNTIRENTIRGLINNYIPAGLTYEIDTY